MTDEETDLLKALLHTNSTSGFEEPHQERWRAAVEEFADEVREDDQGNLVAVHRSDDAADGSEDAEDDEGGDEETPSIAFLGHGDEIGMVVRRIDDDGFVMPAAVGNVDPTVTRGQGVTIQGKDGEVTGVVGQQAIHLRDEDEPEPSPVSDQRIDIGASDRGEAQEKVSIGDPMVLDTKIRELGEDDGDGSRIAARGLDNRSGTYAAAAAFLATAADDDVNADVYAVSTVQEEIEKQGAKTVGHDIVPDLNAAFVLDVTFATDHPDATESKGSDVELGGGPVVTRGGVNHEGLVQFVEDVADDLKDGKELEGEYDVSFPDDSEWTFADEYDGGFRFQPEAIPGAPGTDMEALVVQQGGLPVCYLGIPNRYMHTPVEVIDRDDLGMLVELLSALAGKAADRDDFPPDTW